MWDATCRVDQLAPGLRSGLAAPGASDPPGPPARTPRPRVYGDDLRPALVRCWVLLRASAGKVVARFMLVLVSRLRAEGEIYLCDEQAELLSGISASTIDRMLAGEQQRMTPREQHSPSVLWLVVWTHGCTSDCS